MASASTQPLAVTTTPIIAAVSVKAPPFIPSNPATWFVILEAQFNIAGITTSATRFYHALANLPVETVSNLDDVILQAADYDQLKDAVKRFHETSRGELFESFLQEAPLTGKPSHFLLQMTKVAKKVGVGDDMVRHRFQQALPPSLAPVIASQKTLGLDDLGRLADELLPLLKCQTTSFVSEPASMKSNDRFFVNNNNAVRNSFVNNKVVRKSFEPAFSNTLVPFSANQRPKVCRSHIFMRQKHAHVATGVSGQINLV
mgnify:CR=1 FL=1